MTQLHTDLEQDRPGAHRPRITERALALCGAGFVVAVLAGNSLTETVAVEGDGPEATVRELAAGTDSLAVSVGLSLEVLGLLALVLFGAAVAERGRRHAPGSPWPSLAALAAVLLVAVKLASAAPYLAARSALDTLEADTLHALVEANGAAFVLSWLPMALLVGAVAATLRRAAVVGPVAWATGLALSVLGLAAGLLGMLDPQNALPVPFLLSLLWVAVASVRLAVGRQS